jgi:hypothetical protein
MGPILVFYCSRNIWALFYGIVHGRVSHFWRDAMDYGNARNVVCEFGCPYIWIHRPYKDIPPCESMLTSLVACGEGWHNWHHAYPFDYATAEDGFINHTKLLIDFLSLIGQTYDHKRNVLKPKTIVHTE